MSNITRAGLFANNYPDILDAWDTNLPQLFSILAPELSFISAKQNPES